VCRNRPFLTLTLSCPLCPSLSSSLPRDSLHHRTNNHRVPGGKEKVTIDLPLETPESRNRKKVSSIWRISGQNLSQAYLIFLFFLIAILISHSLSYPCPVNLRNLCLLNPASLKSEYGRYISCSTFSNHRISAL